MHFFAAGVHVIFTEIFLKKNVIFFYKLLPLLVRMLTTTTTTTTTTNLDIFSSLHTAYSFPFLSIVDLWTGILRCTFGINFIKNKRFFHLIFFAQYQCIF
jgi:hypothetical protein